MHGSFSHRSIALFNYFLKMEIQIYYFLVTLILVIFSIFKYIYTHAYTLKYLHAHSSMKKRLGIKQKSLPSEVLLGITI